MTFSIREFYNWVVTTLGADTTLNGLGISADSIFASQAPEATEFPYIIIQRQAAAHDFVLAAEAVQRHYVLIKCVSLGIDGGDLARRIMERVNTLLQDQDPTFTHSYVASVRAQTDVDYVEVHPANLTFYNVGIMYVVYLGAN